MPIDWSKFELTEAKDERFAEDGTDLHAVDPDHVCSECQGTITHGQYRAAEVCSGCYFNLMDLGDFE